VSGSAKKRREKARQRERRMRSIVNEREYQAAQFAKHFPGGMPGFLSILGNITSDPVPGFRNETVFVGIDPGKELL
jgi:hypothetical protein